MPPRSPTPDWQRAIILLSGTVVAVVAVGCLYWAQAVFVPLALALFLTFLLTPAVSLLQSRGFPRTPAVIIVVALTAAALVGTTMFVTRQFVALAADLPQYSDNIKQKLHAVRSMAHGPGADRLAKMVEDLSREWSKEQSADSEPRPAPAAPADPQAPPAVIVQGETTDWTALAQATLGSLGDFLGTLTLAVVLLIFMLLKRERLRNRLICLVGPRRLTATTKAVDDATSRISRFLLMQALINGGYGITLSLGLFALGVDYALLWGFLAATLRYIPYLGAWIAAAGPVLLSVVMSSGWTQPLLVLGWIATIELISNNVLEPWLFGQSMGVSEVAMLVAAAFWAFLWGPIGLVLSSPLTVCLVVLGKYVPQLHFIDILLGDEPVLAPPVAFYQRLLARDREEALQIVQEHFGTASADEIDDSLLIPTLSDTKRDATRDELTETEEHEIYDAVAAIGAQLHAERPQTPSDNATTSARVVLWACPARDLGDRTALELLGKSLDPLKWDFRLLGVETLAAELVESVSQTPPGLVCLGSVAPGGLAQARYLCKRLRTHVPEARIIVGRWGASPDPDTDREELLAAGADDVETRMTDTQRQLAAWFPILTRSELPPVSSAAMGQVAPVTAGGNA